MLISGVAARVLWCAIGFVIGIGIVVVVGRSFAAEHGTRKVLPALVFSAIVLGATLAWALNAWNDYVHASATMPGGI